MMPVEAQWEQRPRLEDLAVAAEDPEPAELGDEALDVGAGTERGAELAEERLQPDLGREALRGSRLLTGEERGLPGDLARVRRRSLLEHEPGPEDDQEGAGVRAEAQVRGRVKRRIGGDLRGESDADVLRIGAGGQHQADGVESLLDLVPDLRMIERRKLGACDGTFPQQPRADQGGLVHRARGSTSPGVSPDRGASSRRSGHPSPADMTRTARAPS